MVRAVTEKDTCIARVGPPDGDDVEDVAALKRLLNQFQLDQMKVSREYQMEVSIAISRPLHKSLRSTLLWYEC
jgi:hypothetical protein